MVKSMMEHALEYAESGFPVFPLIPGSKKPFDGSNGCLDATTDEDTIVAWWTEHPDANIGISTDGLAVIDIDGADNSWLRDEAELYSSLMQNAACQTPRGGVHYWFAQEYGRAVKCSAGKVAPNVDIRGDGGYVVVPPSYVLDEEKGIDGRYLWYAIVPLGMRSELTPLPSWVYTAIEQGHRPAVELLQSGNIIPCGQRNTALTRLAGVARRYGATEGEIRAFLRAVNSGRCADPLSNSEVDAIARSICRYEPDQSCVAMVEDWAGQDAETATDPGNIPAELMQVPGLIGQVIEYNLQTAFKPQPELALAAALCLMGVITGRKVEDNYGTRTNLYMFGVAGSGAGKEHARKVNKQILTLAGAEDLIGPEGFASHAGVVSAVDEHPAILFQIDEFGRLLKTLKNPGLAPHLYGIITVLLKLYTSANSQFVGDAYADLKRIKKIHEPHAVVYGTTVPESFFEGLTVESLSDGFLSRCLCVFASNELPEPVEAEKLPVPASIIEEVTKWVRFQPGGNLSSQYPQPYQVALTAEATDIFRQVEESSRSRQADRESPYSSIWSRVEEKSRTLALLYACSRDGIEEPVVDGDAAAWGATLADLLTRQLVFRSQFWITSGVHEAKLKEIYRVVLAAGSRGITRTELGRKMQKFPRRERDELIEDLIQNGYLTLETENDPGQGRPRTVIRALK